MLPNEIEPAADAGLEALQEIRIILGLAKTSDQKQFTLTEEELKQIQSRVEFADRTITRFKVCMADEVRQKTSFRKKLMENKIYPY
jgi:hypothetical protein